MFDVEKFWEDILGGAPERTLAAYRALPLDEQITVYAHLKDMATEEGWSEPQKLAAQAALKTLDEA